MSEQDKDRIAANDDDNGEDVDAHKHALANDEGEGDGDDVEAHQHAARGQHAGRGASDEGDDDVEAHQHSGRG